MIKAKIACEIQCSVAGCEASFDGWMQLLGNTSKTGQPGLYVSEGSALVVYAVSVPLAHDDWEVCCDVATKSIAVRCNEHRGQAPLTFVELMREQARLSRGEAA